jgi:IclR family transcriptional regulator, pca regulon regulatory protein
MWAYARSVRGCFYDAGVTLRQDPAATAQGEPPQGAGGVQSVARALSILELFNDRQPELTTNEIASLTGLTRGTAYRFCRTLLSLEYLDEVGPSTFRPGVKCISLAQAALGSRGIIQVAMPFLNALRDRVQESVNMVILDGTDIVYVARLLNSDLITLRVNVGSRMPAYATSLGRSILAFLPPKETASILERSDLQPLTPWTLTTRDAIEASLVEIRAKGYAYNEQGVAPGLRGIAAPILDATARPIASINLSVARPLTDDEVSTHLAPEVMETARQISARAVALHVG